MNEDIFIYDNFLSKKECEEFISLHDNITKRPIPNIANVNNIGILDEHPIVDQVKSFIENKLNISTELFQADLWKRSLGLGMHKHNPNQRKDNDLTSIIYLNEDFDGGEFCTDKVVIKPKAGMLITFDGMKIMHGVAHPSSQRYTIICWWKNTKFKDKDLN
jgi:hypothetical protein